MPQTTNKIGQKICVPDSPKPDYIPKAERVLTCVYCGMEYPQGTPSHGSQILTDHIKVCPKHPMREAEQKIIKLRTALVGLVGAETKEELEQMEAGLRILPAPDNDIVAAINAIHALLETGE